MVSSTADGSSRCVSASDKVTVRSAVSSSFSLCQASRGDTFGVCPTSGAQFFFLLLLLFSRLASVYFSLCLSLFLGLSFRKSTGRFARTFCLSSRYRSTIYTLFELFGRCSPSLSLSFCFFPFLFLLVERIIKLAIPDGTWRDFGQTIIVFSYFLFFFFSDLLSFEPFSICAPLNGKLFSANVGILN